MKEISSSDPDAIIVRGLQTTSQRLQEAESGQTPLEQYEADDIVDLQRAALTAAAKQGMTGPQLRSIIDQNK